MRQIVEAPSALLQDQTNLLAWLAQFWRVIGQVEEWNAPTLENSWANAGSPYETAGYYKDPFGQVHLKGAIGVGASGTTAFTLPSGYRPIATLRIASADTGGNHYTEITASGEVQPQRGAAGNAYLDGVSFRAEN